MRSAQQPDPVPEVVVVSPDTNVEVAFALLDRDGKTSSPCYRVAFHGRPLLDWSRLDISLSPSGSVGSNLLVRDVARSTSNTTYPLFPGKASIVRDQFNEAVIRLDEQNEPHRRIELVFRACNDGMAFRYRIPKQPALTDFTVMEEKSTFAIVGNPTAYALPVPSFTTQYEFYYRPAPAEELTSDTLLALPLLLEHPDHTCLAIAEADLDDYAGMYLSPAAGAAGVLTSRLSPLPTDPQICVKAALPHVTPWRVLMIGDNPGRLIESDLLSNLNPPCAIADTSWIKVGKTTFPWWNGYEVQNERFRGGLNTETMKYYIDFCAEHGIEYHSLDGLDNVAWYGGSIVPYQGAEITRGLPGLNLPEVIDYAKQKGVRLRLWMHWGAARAHMEKAFPLYEQWGIEGVMIDFVERDDQEAVNFIRDLIKLAAKHHLTVTLHNIHKPTGLTRTYPNLMAIEGVLNLEYDKWDPIGSTPQHEVTVPFTRMLTGPVDYHHGSFRHATEKNFKPRNVGPVTIGTRTRQLARYVVYEDFLPMIADSVDAYRGQPGLDFLVKVPTSWDETRVPSGEVGEYITIARRHGREWYVGSMTDSSGRRLKIPMEFLGPGRFVATVYSDDPTKPDEPSAMNIARLDQIRASDTITAVMAPAGGHVIHLKPAD